MSDCLVCRLLNDEHASNSYVDALMHGEPHDDSDHDDSDTYLPIGTEKICLNCMSNLSILNEDKDSDKRIERSINITTRRARFNHIKCFLCKRQAFLLMDISCCHRHKNVFKS